MSEQVNTRSLKGLVGTLEVSDVMTHTALSLVPIRGESVGSLDYMLSSEAIPLGLLAVTEVSQAGSVPELLVTSTADKMILLLDGEQLVGAKQNRILNTSILLPPKAKTKVPVSCVEQGRWRHTSTHFEPAMMANARLRSRKSADVTENLRRTGHAESNQGAVWDEVAQSLGVMDVASPTMALHAAYEAYKSPIEGFLKALPYPAGSRGVLAAIRGHFVAVDLFDKTQTLEKVWNRLITGYALDAMIPGAKPHDGITLEAAQRILARIEEVTCQAFPSVGIGEDWRFSAQDVVGQALVAENVCVHLSMFPNDDMGRIREEHERGIEPPSRRRRFSQDDRVY